MILSRDTNLVFWLALASLTGVVISCVPRPGGIKRKSPRHPFYLHEAKPDIEELSEGASGKKIRPITRGSEEYKRLSKLYNPGIIFHESFPEPDDTRLMSKRCMDALNKLEKLVKQRWPKIKLLVLTAWDGKNSASNHKRTYLHREGRAVDITTSDFDSTKLGWLASLAVEAGFDWVHYVHKHRVHASVRSDQGSESSGMGCFRNNSTVQTEGGKTKRLDQLSVGDKVQSVNENGQLIYSEVIMFIDNKPHENNVVYFVLETDKPRAKLYLTRTHLVYVKKRFSSTWHVEFARSVQIKDMVNVSINGTLVTAEVTRILVTTQKGAIAPLTYEGNIIVDGVLASCYAALDDQTFVDSLFMPAKTLYKYTPSLLNGEKTQQGVHWYARLLLFLNEYLQVLT